MTVLNDVALRQIAVLDSTMAYREAGNPDSPTALFCTETRLRPTYGGTSSRSLRPWHIASRPISSGSGSRESLTSNIGFLITSAISMHFLKRPASHRHTLWRRTGERPWPFTWRRADRSSFGGSPLWNSSVPCQRGTIFIRLHVKLSKDSEHPESGRR